MNSVSDQQLLAEPVGFEFYFRHHLSWHSLDFGEISENRRPGNHIETRSEVCTCGRTVGNVTDVLIHNMTIQLTRSYLSTSTKSIHAFDAEIAIANRKAGMSH